MKHSVAALITVLILACGFAKPKSVGERLVDYMNTQNIKGLDSLLADDFTLSRTFVDLSHNRTSFLTQYVPMTKQLHSRFEVIESATVNGVDELIVQDHGDFFTFLQIPEPRWRLLVYKNNINQITKAVIDTSAGFSEYMATAKLVSGQFDLWLRETHPDETVNMLIADTNYLYSKRLLEFRNR